MSRRIAAGLLLLPVLAGAWLFFGRVEEQPLPPLVVTPKGEPILIGEIGSLTGPEAEFGISTRNGIELAINEANFDGGVNGRSLSLRVYDDQSKPEGAARATARLLTIDHVSLIIGEATSASSLAMAPIAQAAQVPMITPASTNPSVTEGRDYVFRACFSDAFQGLVMARYARETLKLERVAVLVETQSVYSEGLGKEFAHRFTELGGVIVASLSYSKGDTDFRVQLSAIAKLHPGALYLPGYVREVVAIAQQAKQQGLEVTLLGGDGWDSEKLFETGGTWIDGAFITNHYSADDPSVQGFVRAYQDAFGFVPDARAALGYDAARLAVDAMRRSPELSGPALRAALFQTRDFAAVTGMISIDAERNAVKPAVVLAVEKGKFRFIKIEQP